jgi:hypothetical protein
MGPTRLEKSCYKQDLFALLLSVPRSSGPFSSNETATSYFPLSEGSTNFLALIQTKLKAAQSWTSLDWNCKSLSISTWALQHQETSLAALKPHYIRFPGYEQISQNSQLHFPPLLRAGDEKDTALFLGRKMGHTLTLRPSTVTGTLHVTSPTRLGKRAPTKNPSQPGIDGEGPTQDIDLKRQKAPSPSDNMEEDPDEGKEETSKTTFEWPFTDAEPMSAAAIVDASNRVKQQLKEDNPGIAPSLAELHALLDRATAAVIADSFLGLPDNPTVQISLLLFWPPLHIGSCGFGEELQFESDPTNLQKLHITFSAISKLPMWAGLMPVWDKQCECSMYRCHRSPQCLVMSLNCMLLCPTLLRFSGPGGCAFPASADPLCIPIRPSHTTIFLYISSLTDNPSGSSLH